MKFISDSSIMQYENDSLSKQHDESLNYENEELEESLDDL